ncbi:hypothetical protein [Mumia sp. DW29H23]|uniref:hypothetical protein n=1 Tax=Mumia sp. DW29H23 TaxID=3421241 RepID=UPI003D6919DB
MRTVASFLLGLLALVAVAATAPGLWFERTIVDESGYVALAGPLGEDPEFRAALAETVTDGVVEGAGLDGAAGRLAEPVVRRVAEQMTQLNGFDAAWAETSALSHRLNVTDIPPAELDGRLGVDLTPMVNLVADAANRRLGTQLSAPGDLVVAFGTPEQRDLLDRARDLSSWSWVLLGASVVLVVACLLVARRRGTTLALLGAGLIVVAVVEMALVITGGDQAVDEAAATAGFGRTLMTHLHDAIVTSYGTWMVALGAAGVLAVVVGLVVRLRSGRAQTA